MSTLERLRAHIATLSGVVTPDQIADDTPLIESRILSSLQVVELLLFLEELRGKPVHPKELTPAAFRTVKSIHDAFLAGGPT